MPLDRRRFLVATGLSMAGTALARPARAIPASSDPSPKAAASPPDWSWVRDQFGLRRDLSHFASTAIVWGRREAWAELQPSIPAFEEPPYITWQHGVDPGPTQGAWMSPGRFHAYEHMWALPAAFALRSVAPGSPAAFTI
jgi:hypothetical protein